MFGLSTLLSFGPSVLGFFKSPKILALVILLLICGGAWGYHGYKVGKLNTEYSDLESVHIELQGKYSELELTIEKARYANQENLDTIQILRAERSTSDLVSRNLFSKNKALQLKYDKIFLASKGKKDATLSEKLVVILNGINGVKE